MQEKMTGQHQGRHERIQDDGRHGTKSNCVAQEDEGRPITIWRGTIGEKILFKISSIIVWQHVTSKPIMG